MIYFPFSHFYISAFRHLDLSKFYPFADDSNEKKIGFNSRLINRRTFLFRPSPVSGIEIFHGIDENSPLISSRRSYTRPRSRN